MNLLDEPLITRFCLSVERGREEWLWASRVPVEGDMLMHGEEVLTVTRVVWRREPKANMTGEPVLTAFVTAR